MRLGLVVQQHIASGVECEKASRPPGRSSRAASGTVRYGSAKVIAPWSQKTMSKLASGERHLVGARVDEREVDAGCGHQLARVLELARRVVEADRPRAAAGEQDRPLGRAAAELEHVLAGDVAEDPQLGLGDLPHRPSAARRAADELAVPLLVLVAACGPSARGCARRQTSRHRRTRARPRARPTRASPSRARGCPASRARGRRGSCPGADVGRVRRAHRRAHDARSRPRPRARARASATEVMNSTSSPKNGFSACSA